MRATYCQRELEHQRTTFWETRVEGNAVSWQNIRIAAEALINKDVVLANAILEVKQCSSRISQIFC